MDDLIERAKQGDESAVERLVADYKSMIRSLANKFYLVGGDKDDLLQEGMLGFFLAIHNYDESKGSFPGFARLCVMRQILDAVKRYSGANQKPLYNYVDLDAVADVSDSGPGPLDNLLRREYAQKISQIINEQLSPLERQVLLLFADGYSYDDIASRTGKSYKAVDGALQRARRKLIDSKE